MTFAVFVELDVHPAGHTQRHFVPPDVVIHICMATFLVIRMLLSMCVVSELA